ncbi:MAG TPA: MFS transporter [Acidimicrobiia bacterium]|nr:MFS transporter [Acidimicrobiia bacterium]
MTGNGRAGEVLRQRNFRLYLLGVVSSQIGSRATTAAILYHVYQLTGSTLQVGLVGAAQAAILFVLSPVGGLYADRLDRRRLLQACQAVSMLVSLSLGLVTLLGAVELWHILTAVVLTGAAVTFEQPARQALVPAVVGTDHLVEALAFTNPARELAILIGPAVGGLLLTIDPGVVYVFDAATYVAMIFALAAMHLLPQESLSRTHSAGRSIVEGFRFVVRRPLIGQAMVLDMTMTIFGAYRVLLPSLAADVFLVGPAGYGLLAAAPAAGGLLGSALVFALIRRVPQGRVVLGATAAYGVSVIGLAQAPAFAMAVIAVGFAGCFDTLSATIRHGLVQLETPDVLRGRVSSVHQLASRGGPSVGDAGMGALASAIGPVAALTAGGLVPIVAAIASLVTPTQMRSYGPLGDRQESALRHGPNQGQELGPTAEKEEEWPQ